MLAMCGVPSTIVAVAVGVGVSALVALEVGVIVGVDELIGVGQGCG